jgi:hypothetical protein
MAGLGKTTFVAGTILTASQVNGYLMDQSVMTFSTSGARGSAIPSPSEGMVTTLSDSNRVEIYDGAAWKIVYQPPTTYIPTATNYVRSSGSLVYSVAGHTMFITGTITVSSVSGGILISIPSGFTMSGDLGGAEILGSSRLVAGAGTFLGHVRRNTSTQLRINISNSDAVYLRENEITSTVPATWTSGNSFTVSATFQLA